MSNACTFKKTAMHICGSYQFNLGKYQGDLCDVHYWQTESEQLRAIAKEQYEALKRMVAWTGNVAGDTYDPKQSSEEIESHNQCEKAIAKYEDMQK